MLKASQDGLTKAWKAEKVWEPFYKGGKIQTTNDGKRFVCEYEGNIKVVSVEDPSDADTLLDEEDEHAAISTFALHPNGKEIVVATTKFNISHYNLEDKTMTRTIRAHRMPILCMEYDPTGTLVATGSSDRSVRVWDITKGYCTHSFTVHTDIVKTVTFHPDPQRLQLFSTSDDNTIAMYDLRDQQCVAQFKDHFSLPTSLAFSPDGYILVSSGRDKVLNFYELREKVLIKTIPIMDELEGVVIFDHEKSLDILKGLEITKKRGTVSPLVLVTAGAQGVLRVYSFEIKGKDVSSFSVVSLFNIPLSNIPSSVALAEEISTLKGISRLMLVNQERVMAITNDFNFAAFTPAQFNAAVNKMKHSSAEDSDNVYMKPSELIISNHGDILDIIRLPARPAPDSTGIRFRMGLVSNSPQLRIIDQNLHTEVLEGHTDIILAADVSPDGTWMVTSSKDRTCRLWHIPQNECKAVGEGHTDPVGAVCISHFHATYASRKVFMVSGAGDKILKRWSLPLHQLETPVPKSLLTSVDYATKKITSSHSIRAHDKDINCVTVSPNDAIIASASQDKTIRLWNSEDLTPIATLHGHKRGVWKVLFSNVDKVLVSCSGDRTVKIWSVVDFTIVKTLEGHTASVLNTKFVNNGTQLISGSADGLIRLWTVRTGECESTLDKHEDRVWALEPLPSSGKDSNADDEQKGEPSEHALAAPGHFCSAGSDSKIILWKDVTEEEEMQRLAEAEEMLVLEQQMTNDIRNKNYGKALNLALTLAHPSKVLTILTAILEEEKPDSAYLPIDKLFQEEWSLRLDPYVTEMSDENLHKILGYLKDWNTNSRHCYVSQILLHSLFRIVKAEKLMQWKDFRDLSLGLQAYTERHYQRINRLAQASHFLDYIVSTISLMPIESINALAVKKIDSEALPSALEETKGMARSESVVVEEEVPTKKSSKKRKNTSQ